MSWSRRTPWIVTLVLIAASLVGSPARAVDREPIDIPMAAGILPACPPNLASFSPSDVFTSTYVYSQFDTFQELGLLKNCANMNWQDPEDPSSVLRGVNAHALPDTVSISPNPTTVVLRMDSLATPGPFNTDFPSCMPRSTRTGGCTAPEGDDARAFVAYRLANNDGSFSGRWTLAGLPGSPNPYFDMTRGSCPNNWSSWSSGYETQGFPCPWTLRFTTDITGRPVLTKAMQVAIAASGRSGVESANGFTGPKYDVGGLISMLFTPGASTSLSLTRSASSVGAGRPVTLTARAVGPAPGARVNFYRALPGHRWTFLGHATTNSRSQAALVVRPTVNASYRARLVSSGVETATSASLRVEVRRAVALTVTRLRPKVYRFASTIAPRAGTSSVKLQRLVNRTWTTARTTSGVSGRAAFTVTLPAGRSSWRIVTPATTSYGLSVSPTKSITRR